MTVQHAGITMAVNKNSALLLSHRGLRSYYNYESKMVYNVLGSTGAFLIIPKTEFNRVKGFNEKLKIL